jgi:hypothetical protein
MWGACGCLGVNGSLEGGGGVGDARQFSDRFQPAMEAEVLSDGKPSRQFRPDRPMTKSSVRFDHHRAASRRKLEVFGRLAMSGSMTAVRQSKSGAAGLAWFVLGRLSAFYGRFS